MWRIATSERFHVSPHEIWEKWSLVDLINAHEALDILEEAASRPTPKP